MPMAFDTASRDGPENLRQAQKEAHQSEESEPMVALPHAKPAASTKSFYICATRCERNSRDFPRKYVYAYVAAYMPLYAYVCAGV